MSPSELSWLQGCLFLFLGVGVAYLFYWLQNRRTNRGTSHGELSSIRVESQIATTPFDDAQSSGGDEEARSPSNLLNPGEAMALTGSPRYPDRNRLRSESRRRPISLLEPSFETRKTSNFLESVAQTEVSNLARRETAYITTIADSTPSPMSSQTARLLRPSGGEDEGFSPSDPVGEAVALPGTPNYPDRERCRSNSCSGMDGPEERTKSPFETFEKFIAKDVSRNIGRPEPASMIDAGSFSTSMASTTAVRRRPRRRHPARESVSEASWKIRLVDHAQSCTLAGLHRRPKMSQGPSGEVYILERGIWVAEMRPQNSKKTYPLGYFESQLQAVHAVVVAAYDEYYSVKHSAYHSCDDDNATRHARRSQRQRQGRFNDGHSRADGEAFSEPPEITEFYI